MESVKLYDSTYFKIPSTVYKSTDEFIYFVGQSVMVEKIVKLLGIIFVNNSFIDTYQKDQGRLSLC
jgi:hypothetical protein